MQHFCCAARSCAAVCCAAVCCAAVCCAATRAGLCAAVCWHAVNGHSTSHSGRTQVVHLVQSRPAARASPGSSRCRCWCCPADQPLTASAKETWQPVHPPASAHSKQRAGGLVRTTLAKGRHLLIMLLSFAHGAVPASTVCCAAHRTIPNRQTSATVNPMSCISTAHASAEPQTIPVTGCRCNHAHLVGAHVLSLHQASTSRPHASGQHHTGCSDHARQHVLPTHQ